MIDLNHLREQPELILGLLRAKDPAFDGALLLSLDEEVRQIRLNVEELRHAKNELAQQAKQGVTPAIREQSKQFSLELKEKEEQLKELEERFKHLYLRCPNVPFKDVPEGGKEANKVVKVVGEKPVFTFTPQHHVALGEKAGWFNFQAAAKMSGNNFALYQGDMVSLIYALMHLMFKNNLQHGFRPMLPPYLVNYQALQNASNFPRFENEVYALPADNLYLTPTSEVNLTDVYQDHIFLAEELPVRMTAWTSCFRREAGGYGAHERGLIRLHQFEKVELYSITTPEKSAEEQERMLACAEAILQKLNLHYRVSLLATGDCSFASAKTYDIEVWMPGQGEYKEISSISNCTDFQARRAGIRFRPRANEKTHLAHTLNGSSLALPRLLVALIETYQQADGSVVLPEVLKNISIEVPGGFFKHK